MLILRKMPIVDDVVKYITDELNIEISEKNKELITDKFYPDIKDKFYWSCDIECSFYEGVVSKDEYEKIKTLPPNTNIHFAEIAKYVCDECELEDILPFTDDINKIKKFYDKGGQNSNNYFDLMNYFYETEKLDYEDN